MSRASGQPPRLEGFDFLQLLGSGGFAEVYLYEQHLPRRRVAVKALSTEGFDDRAVDRFRDEANLMAQLSAHPSIVTIHQAGIAESGQPYLVMEYCAQPDFGRRFRAAPLSVTETLAVGVQIAGAVETAHRAGVLHRDIKPANILVTDFHRPALTDFGIAGTLGGASAVDALSVPWAAPEVLGGDPVLRVSSDVYSLGATLYSLLAGRAPFELPGGDNAPEAMAARIRAGAPVPLMGRADVPPAVEEALAVALAASPSARYTSALSLGRALQRVQEQLGFSVTPIDVTDDPLARNTFDDSRARPGADAGAAVPGAGAGAAAGLGVAGAAGAASAVPPFPTGTPVTPMAPVPPAETAPLTPPGGAGAPTVVMPAASGADAGGGVHGGTAPGAPTAATVPAAPAYASSVPPLPPATAPTERFAPAPYPTGASGGPAGGSASAAAAGPGGAPLESTVRRAPAAAPVYTAPVRRKAAWPGIVIDVVLVLAVAGAAVAVVMGV